MGLTLLIAASPSIQSNPSTSNPDPVDFRPYIRFKNRQITAWLNGRGVSMGAIPRRRVDEVALELESFRRRNPSLFWGGFLPTISIESGFTNACYDRDLPEWKRSCGYGGLQARVAREVGRGLGYAIPNHWPEIQVWILREWPSGLDIAWEYLDDLRAATDDDLQAMSAYRTGLKGWAEGRRAISDTMIRERNACLEMGRLSGDFTTSKKREAK
jgi:hypothetical protein